MVHNCSYSGRVVKPGSKFSYSSKGQQGQAEGFGAAAACTEGTALCEHQQHSQHSRQSMCNGTAGKACAAQHMQQGQHVQQGQRVQQAKQCWGDTSGQHAQHGFQTASYAASTLQPVRVPNLQSPTAKHVDQIRACTAGRACRAGQSMHSRARHAQQDNNKNC